MVPMAIKTTMTGSWFRTPEIMALLKPEVTPNGEISSEHRKEIEVAETRAIHDQLHPAGSEIGLNWVSNGEQRKSGYTYYLPNRFAGFSKKERVAMPFGQSLIAEFQESNPAFVQMLSSGQSNAFSAPKIESKLEYTGEKFAIQEAQDAVRLARQERAERIFLPAPSPGVTTIFFPISQAYSDHYEYLFDLAKEMRREYQAILSVDGIDLQIDSPDLAMGKQTGEWSVDFYEALPRHVDAINEAIAGLPKDRIRVHYCYGNWVGSHRFDADYRKVLEQIVRLKVGTIVGEMGNPRHEGDSLILRDYLKEHEWPKRMRLAAGVIDVKTAMVESPQTIAFRLQGLASIDKLNPNDVLGGTDCGFETFANFGNVTYAVALQKLKSLAEGAALANKSLGLN